MSIELRVSSRYARALFDDAQKKGILDVIESDVKSVLEVIKSNRELYGLLKSPVISMHTKGTILDKIFKNQLHPDTTSFLKMILGKRRGIVLSDILEVLYRMIQEDKGIVPASITVATQLSDTYLDKIKAILASKIGSKMDLTIKIDPSILGGYILQYSDKLLDASVATQLLNVRKQLNNAN
jgi:F-type H+-transporting ATPase subunit delta